MPKKRYAAEQIIRHLREAEVELAKQLPSPSLSPQFDFRALVLHLAVLPFHDGSRLACC